MMVRSKLFFASISVLIAFQSAQAWRKGAPASSQFFPAGVTTRAIDGETMQAGSEPKTMTHTYYSANGYSLAHTAGWDNPSFFPIGPFEGRLDTSNTNAGNPINPNTPLVTTWLDLNWNHSFIVDGNYVDTVAQSNSITVDISFSGGTTQNPNVAFGTEAIGIQAQDEPTLNSEITTPIANASNTTYQNGRYWWTTGTHNNLSNGPPGGAGSFSTMTAYLAQQIATPNTTLRGLGAYAVDFYWFAGARSGDAGFAGQAQAIINFAQFGASAPTQDQMQRGSLYGNMIYAQRNGWLGGTLGLMPIFSVVEDGGPYGANTTLASYITPPEMNWGAWAGIIAGARGLIWFDNSAAGPGCATSCFNNMYQSFYQTLQTGNSVIVYNQMKATNAQIKSFATVINSPFVDNYASVSPVGSQAPTPPALPVGVNSGAGASTITISGGVPNWVVNGTPITNGNGGLQAGTTITGQTTTTISISLPTVGGGVHVGDVMAMDGTAFMFNTGIDMCAKYNNSSGGDNKFYIFAVTRNSEAAGSTSATFTVKDSGATKATILDGRGGSISLSAPSGGNRTFTDSFNPADVHIYRMD